MPDKPQLVPKYLLQKIFPKDCLGLVDIANTGTQDALLIEGINILAPFSMPKTINLGKYSVENVEKYGTVTIDGVKMTLSSETILSKVYLAIGEKLFTLDDILQGKAAGRGIPMGESIKLIVKLSSFQGLKMQPGKHQISLAFKFSDGEPFLFTLDRELKADRMHLTLD
jgi:hypothetical protein